MAQTIPTSTINYDSTSLIFPNPERGFSAYRAGGITLSFVDNLRLENITVIQRIYTIPQFINSPLSDNFLNIVEADFNTARDGGAKLVLRFSYTDYQNGEDAPLQRILEHIEQLKPLFQKHFDVIAYIEAGFIGAWGEWYYSSNNLNNTEDRRAVLFALLDALPVERCVVIRTPDYKRKIYEHNEPLTPEQAFNGTKRARTGAHNDCFLANATDYGTYLVGDIEGDKNYLNLDNRFVPQGGETCSPSAFSGCSNALIDLERMHWSVLNKDYHSTVLSDWEAEGCMDEIKRRLGYRFRLLQAVIVDSVKPGGRFELEFDLINKGFASPFNNRILEIILRNTTTVQTYRLETSDDPRRWMPGDTANITVAGGIPQDMPQGTYEVLLHLADPVSELRYRAKYAIRFANENVWEESSGYNSLLHYVKIYENAPGELYSGDSYFESFKADSTEPPPPAQIVIDGDFDDWQNVARLDVAPNEELPGDAMNDAVDLVDIWAANDERYLYISYSLNGAMDNNKYFYHVFFDTDNDTATGFHSEESYAGFEYMVENEQLWQYSGVSGEWSWNYAGAVDFALGTDKKRVEIAVDRMVLETANAGDCLDMVFNISNQDDNYDDDYAPDQYKNRSFNYLFIVAQVEKIERPQLPANISIRMYPNPFNCGVTIFLSQNLHKDFIKAAIYNISGRLIKSFTKSELNNSRLIWDGTDNRQINVSSGVYLFKVSNGSETATSKLIKLK